MPRRRRRLFWFIAIVTIAIIAIYVCVPRTAHMHKFDSDAVAQSETQMWREYYDHRKTALAMSLYGLSRDQYGYSPLDSIRLARSAANSAIAFKDSTDDATADLALPALRDYFQIIHDHSDCTFDVDQAAKLELNWWKLRRHKVGPVEYGHAIAKATACIYGVRSDTLEEYAQLRAEAMDYRDQHDGTMTDADWDHVEQLLKKSFAALRAQVTK
jgi:hypothetical protein